MIVYVDSLGQKSNTVSQTITLVSVAPMIQTSTIPPLVKVSCEAEVSPGFLAPTVDIPEDLTIETCATNLNEGYEDVNLEIITEPPMKGWHVTR